MATKTVKTLMNILEDMGENREVVVRVYEVDSQGKGYYVDTDISDVVILDNGDVTIMLGGNHGEHKKLENIDPNYPPMGVNPQNDPN